MLGGGTGNYVERDVEILAPRTFSPFVASDDGLASFEERRAAVGDEGLRAAGVMAIHHFSNSWVGALAGEFVNPDPLGISGFVFVPGFDSPGHDLRNGGRDIARLAVDCEGSEAVAFNTDGFLKTSVGLPGNWERRDDWGGNEGLYLDQELYRRLAPSSSACARKAENYRGPGRQVPAPGRCALRSSALAQSVTGSYELRVEAIGDA